MSESTPSPNDDSLDAAEPAEEPATQLQQRPASKGDNRNRTTANRKLDTRPKEAKTAMAKKGKKTQTLFANLFQSILGDDPMTPYYVAFGVVGAIVFIPVLWLWVFPDPTPEQKMVNDAGVIAHVNNNALWRAGHVEAFEGWSIADWRRFGDVGVGWIVGGCIMRRC